MEDDRGFLELERVAVVDASDLPDLALEGAILLVVRIDADLPGAFVLDGFDDVAMLPELREVWAFKRGRVLEEGGLRFVRVAGVCGGALRGRWRVERVAMKLSEP